MYPCGSAGKESTCSAGGLGSIPGLGRSPGEGRGYPLQYSGLDCTGHGVAKSRTRLSDFHFADKGTDSRVVLAGWKSFLPPAQERVQSWRGGSAVSGRPRPPHGSALCLVLPASGGPCWLMSVFLPGLHPLWASSPGASGVPS